MTGAVKSQLVESQHLTRVKNNVRSPGPITFCLSTQVCVRMPWISPRGKVGADNCGTGAICVLGSSARSENHVP